MANIAKKISFIIFSAVIVFFITGNSFANNDMLHKAAESTKNGVGHTRKCYARCIKCCSKYF